MRAALLTLLLLSLTFAQSYLMIVHNPNSQALTDFQVRAKLPSELKGQAISVRDLYGNTIPFCYETATGECTTDPTKGDGYVWVKVPSIPANGDAKLVVQVGENGAVKGDEVFEFYDDFNEYPNGAFDGGSKWIVSRYVGDELNECVIENGTLWLVRISRGRGCNIAAKNYKLKYNENKIVEIALRVRYSCTSPYINDGDGLVLIIDGRDNSPLNECWKGVYLQGQGIAIEVYTDSVDGNGYIGIGPHYAYCTPLDKPTSHVFGYQSVGLKDKYLQNGILEVSLTGTHLKVKYFSLGINNNLEERANFSHKLWDPHGKGLLIIGAGTGCSNCNNDISCKHPDSAHGIDWIRIRKYASESPKVTFQPYVSLPNHLWNSLTDSQKNAFLRCYSLIKNKELCLNAVKSMNPIHLNTILLTNCKALLPELVYLASKVKLCEPTRLSLLLLNTIAKMNCPNVTLPLIPNAGLERFVNCIVTKPPQQATFDSCIHKAVTNNTTLTYYNYLEAKEIWIAYEALYPWISSCSKGAQPTPSEVNATVKLVLPAQKVPSAQIMPKVSVNVSSTIASKVLAPYMRLENLYQEVSKSTGYKASVLKGPFQRNIRYLTDLAQVSDLLTRTTNLIEEAELLLNKTDSMLRKEITFDVIYGSMGLVQKAKVDLVIANNTIAQLERLIGTMEANKPAASCEYSKALKLTKEVLSAKNALEMYNIMMKIKKMGGLDYLVKCLISGTIDEIAKGFKVFKQSMAQRLNDDWEKANMYEKIVKELSLK